MIFGIAWWRNLTFHFQIQVEVCKTDVHRYCEKFSNIFPFPVEEQNCHFEPKKICELEMKTRPKKAKKYSYTKDCKEQPREICDQCEKKTIQPVCEQQERLVCTYEPVESCRDEDKQYCHKVEKVELEEFCDMEFDFYTFRRVFYCVKRIPASNDNST